MYILQQLEFGTVYHNGIVKFRSAPTTIQYYQLQNNKLIPTANRPSKSDRIKSRIRLDLKQSHIHDKFLDYTAELRITPTGYLYARCNYTPIVLTYTVLERLTHISLVEQYNNYESEIGSLYYSDSTNTVLVEKFEQLLNQYNVQYNIANLANSQLEADRLNETIDSTDISVLENFFNSFTTIRLSPTDHKIAKVITNRYYSWSWGRKEDAGFLTEIDTYTFHKSDAGYISIFDPHEPVSADVPGLIYAKPLIINPAGRRLFYYGVAALDGIPIIVVIASGQHGRIFKTLDEFFTGLITAWTTITDKFESVNIIHNDKQTICTLYHIDHTNPELNTNGLDSLKKSNN